ncbi:hypothetical protein MRB53_002661 [Persea americana]|uniref:Uncharacterized protein n=1 Tax=Persea americana TaxID=3435 RepID=A0ACC2MVU6_PERAE|nr:hypothetical protein MRB53_002661 [Persea americana]
MSSADGNPIPVAKEIDHIRDSVADSNTRVTELTDAILRIQETLANRPPPHQFQGFQGRPIRLDFLVFDGTDPESWIFRVQQFQCLNGIPDDRLDEDPEGSLSKLRQTTAVQDYQAKFERLANRSQILPEAFLIRCFISGLNEDIRYGVKLLNPLTLSHAYIVATRQEEAIAAIVALVNRRSSIKAPPLRTLPPLPPLPSASQPQLAPSPKFAPPATQTASKSFSMPTRVRRLSLTAQQERREKGLCFNCDEQFRPGHSWRPVIAQKLSLVWTTKTPLPWKLL